MIYFRSVNTRDKKLIDNNQDLLCRLANNPKYEHYNLLMNGIVGNALDLILKHVMGYGIFDNTTPWISLTKDFDKAASEYGIPQAGNYNPSLERKPIIVVDYPDPLIYRATSSILSLRNTIRDEFVVEISDDNLLELYDSGAINAKYDNENFQNMKEFFRSLTEKGEIPGFSNYSNKVSEVLAYKKVSNKYIKAVLSPSLVDIVYACGIDLNDKKNLSFIQENYADLNKTLESLNTKYLGKNVFELLEFDKLNDPNASIEEYYQDLLIKKIKEMKEIVKGINSSYKTDFEVKRILDEGITVCDFDNINNFKSRKKDLLLIKYGKKIYLYFHKFEKYICIGNHFSFTFEEAKNKCLCKK